MRRLHKNIGLYLPESFAVYFSWEQYFTEILEKETANDRLMRYSKSKISDYYISERILQKVLEIMPEKITKFLT